jgi:hypothetical protein
MSISVAQSRNLETKVQTPQQGLEATATTGSLKALISEANILRLPAAWFLRGFWLSRANSDCGAATTTCSPRHLGTAWWAWPGKAFAFAQLTATMASYKQIFSNFLALGISKYRKSHHFKKIPGQGRRFPWGSSGGATTSQWPIFWLCITK